MKNILLYLIMVLLLFSCTKEEEFVGAENQSLNILWRTNAPHLSWVYLFESEEDYWNHNVQPQYETHARLKKETSTNFFNREAYFFDFESKPYYVKIFGASPTTGYIEHNQNIVNQLKEPLVKNSRTVVEVKTQIEKVIAANIESIEFYNLKDSLNLSPGSNVKYTFSQQIGYYPNQDTIIIEEQNLQSLDGNTLIIEPSVSKVTSFRVDGNRKYFIHLKSESDQIISRHIDLFKMLNKRKIYTGELFNNDSEGNIDYKLQVLWLK